VGKKVLNKVCKQTTIGIGEPEGSTRNRLIQKERYENQSDGKRTGLKKMREIPRSLYNACVNTRETTYAGGTKRSRKRAV